MPASDAGSDGAASAFTDGIGASDPNLARSRFFKFLNRAYPPPRAAHGHADTDAASTTTSTAAAPPALTPAEAAAKAAAETRKIGASKLHFANERTFLSWMNLCLTIGALGMGLINFSDLRGRYIGVGFMAIAVGFMGYALVRYHARIREINQKTRGLAFEEFLGAMSLVGILFAAVGINFGLRLVN